MSAAATPTKTCMICGVDVSGKPRVKDAQGRYACQGACAKEAAARLQAAGAKPAPVIKTVAVAAPAAVAAGAKAPPPSGPPASRAAAPGVDPLLASLVDANGVSKSVPCP
jgi:hypothetical protein